MAIDPSQKEVAATWEAPDSLVPWDQNPRKNDGAPVDAVAQSIKRFGFASPIIAMAGTRQIIAGHTRWKASMKLGLASVPVRFVSLDEGEALALALADNKLGEMAEWDGDLLDEVLADLHDGGIDLAGLGWTPEELAAIVDPILDVDAFDALPEDSPTAVQMTFTMSPEEKETIERAIDAAKSQLGPDVDGNKNGAALHLVACEFLG